jgi:hypothetical protein
MNFIGNLSGRDFAALTRDVAAPTRHGIATKPSAIVHNARSGIGSTLLC